MRIRIILLLCSIISIIGNAQEVSFDDEKCKHYKSLADNSFAYNDFPKAVAFYVKSEKECAVVSKNFYEKLISSIKSSITNSKDVTIRSKYIDTLINTYNSSENKGFYDHSNDLMRAAFILKSTNPDLNKVDELFVRARKNKNIAFSETQIILYFSNLYNLYLSEERDAKPVLKRRIINSYFELTSQLESEGLNEQTITNLNTYFNNVFKECHDILPDIEFYLNTLSKDENEKQIELINFKSTLEKLKCEENPYYKEIIDSLIYIEPSLELYLASAKCLSFQKEYSKEFSTLFFAKKLAKDELVKSEIDFLSAKALFNEGNYSEAYKIAITVNGKLFGESNLIAAQCVALTNKNCGEISILQKLNLFYALELLDKAKKAGQDVQNFVNSYAAQLPTDQELATVNLKRGQQVALKCWGVQIIIPK